MTKVFISYARDGSHGQNLAAQVQEQLQAAGFEVFRDVVGLKPGESFPHRLEFELESSDAMVLVISEKVRKSEWVYNEFSLAKQLGLPVVPLLAESIRLPLWLQNAHYLDFCSGYDWQRLLVSLGGEIPSVSPQQRLKTKTFEAKGSTFQIDNTETRRMASPFAKGGTRGISWASNAGQDEYGQYADLTIKNINQCFRWIKPGTFQMGSPDSEPRRFDNEVLHQVTLSKGFWLADTACTQSFWQAITGNNPAYFKDDLNCPVERVSWHDVQQFIKILNQQQPDLNARLPSEVEWEYACRAGTETAYSFGDEITSQLANFGSNVRKTVPVKFFPPNDWGLYEMHGNVWEWCQDAWQGGLPVIRGGAWLDGGKSCCSAYRDGNGPDFRSDGLGLRLSLGH